MFFIKHFFSWVRIDQTVGYESTESGYENGYETPMGTKRLDTIATARDSPKYSSTSTLPRQTLHRQAWTFPSPLSFSSWRKSFCHVGSPSLGFWSSRLQLPAVDACDTSRDCQELSSVTDIFRISAYAAASIRVDREAEWIVWLFICYWVLFAPLWGSMKNRKFHPQRWQTRSTL